MATKTAANHVDVALTQAAEASQGAALVQQAQGIVIRDKASHEACRAFLKGAKALKKTIADHYAAIKAPLNAARQTVLDMEKKDLFPVEQAIATAERIDTTYVREQQRIEVEARETARLEAEAAERHRRDKEAADAEAAALKLEASSNVLSEREQTVARFVVYRMKDGVSLPSDWLAACKEAGYKDPAAAAKKLLLSPKLIAAVDAHVKAERIRRESEAKQAAPVVVDVVAPVSEVVDGGMRTYYGCDVIHDTAALLRALADAYEKDPALVADVDRYLRPALLTLMSSQARRLRDMFGKVWPSAGLSKRDGTVA